MTAIRSLAIVDEQARHRAAFEAFCRSLTPDELATQVPGAPWTVHGYIAHLATIDSLVAPFLAPLVACDRRTPARSGAAVAVRHRRVE